MELKVSISRVQLYALLGYSLFLTLTGVLLWGGYSVFLRDFATFQERSVADFFLRWFIFPVAFFLVAIVAYRWGERRFTSVLSILSFVLLESSGLLFLWIFQTSQVSEVQLVVISTLMGFSSGLIFISFQRLLATFDLKHAGSIVIGSAVLSPLFYFILVLIPSHPISMLLVYAVVVPLCALCYWGAARLADFSSPCFVDVPSKRKVSADAGMRQLVQPLIYIALSAFIIGLFQTLSLSELDASLVDSIKMIGLFISGLGLLFVWKRFYPRLSLDRIYQGIFLLIATCYLLLPILGNTSMYLFIGLAGTVFSIASALMVITCLEVSKGSGIYPVFVYAVFAGLVYLSSAVGSLVSYMMETAGSIGSTGYFVVALIAIYLLCMITFMAKGKQQDGARGADDAMGDAVIDDGGVPASTHRKCCSLQERFGLSDRESEIAELLACGRDVPSIARKLFISENTVRTHTKNFYRKMGIHTKQEFLNLLEKAPLG